MIAPALHSAPPHKQQLHCSSPLRCRTSWGPARGSGASAPARSPAQNKGGWGGGGQRGSRSCGPGTVREGSSRKGPGCGGQGSIRQGGISPPPHDTQAFCASGDWHSERHGCCMANPQFSMATQAQAPNMCTPSSRGPSHRGCLRGTEVWAEGWGPWKQGGPAAGVADVDSAMQQNEDYSSEHRSGSALLVGVRRTAPMLNLRAEPHTHPASDLHKLKSRGCTHPSAGQSPQPCGCLGCRH